MSITFEEVMKCHPDNETAFDALVEHMKKAVPLLPFVGAGLSKPIYLLWGEVLLEIGKNNGKTTFEKIQHLLKQNKHMDAASLLAKKRGKGRWLSDINKSFGIEKIESENISKAARFLPELWEGGVITTNYDHVLDVVYREAGKPFAGVVIPRETYDQATVDRLTKENRHYVIKLHGDIEYPTKMILRKEDYDEVYGEGQLDAQLPFPKLLCSLPERRNLLFLGCSMEADRTLEVLQQATEEGESSHIAIVELPQVTKAGQDTSSIILDPSTGDKWPELEEKEFRLSNLQVQCIWYPYGQHDAVAVVLQELLKYRKNETQTKDKQVEESPLDLRYGCHGREAFINKCENRLENRPEQLLCIHGAPGGGKTTICKALLQRYVKKGVDVLAVWLQGASGYASFLEKLAEVLHINKDNMEEIKPRRILEKLSRLAENKAMVVYFDNLEDVLNKKEDKDRLTENDKLIISLIGKITRIRGVRVLASSRWTITGFPNINLEPLTLQPAMALFREVWGHTAGNLAALEKQNKVIRDLVKTMDRHPLSIVLVASQGWRHTSISNVADRWEREKGNMSVDVSDNPTQRSLHTSIYTSYMCIQHDRLCRVIWGALALCSGDVPHSLLLALSDHQEEELNKALQLMIRLNLLQETAEGYAMLSPLRERIYEYASEKQDGGEQASINILVKIYQYYLNKAQSRNDGWVQADKMVMQWLDHILYLQEFVFKKRYSQQFLVLHNYLYSYYLYRIEKMMPVLKQLLSGNCTIGLNGLETAHTKLCLGDMMLLFGYLEEVSTLLVDAEQLYKYEKYNLGVAQTLRKQGDLARRLGDVVEAENKYKEAAKRFKLEKNDLGMAKTYRGRADLLHHMGRLGEAQKLYELSIKNYIKTEDELGLAHVLRRQGDLLLHYVKEKENQYAGFAVNGYFEKGNREVAAAFIAKERDEYSLAIFLLNQGLWPQYLGERMELQELYDKSNDWYQQSNAIYKKKKYERGLANVLLSQGSWLQHRGELEAADAKYAEAKKLYQKERDDLGLANVLQRQGDLAVFNRNYMEAKKLYENALQSYILSKAIIGEVRTRGKLCIVYDKVSKNLKNRMIENTKGILANFKYENIKKEIESYLHESERQA